MNINLPTGKVTLNDIEFLSEEPLINQLDNLKEDLYQAQMDNYILDIGWYPEFDINGCFKVFVIKDFDWSNPISIMESISYQQLEKDIEASLIIITDIR